MCSTRLQPPPTALNRLHPQDNNGKADYKAKVGLPAGTTLEAWAAGLGEQYRVMELAKRRAERAEKEERQRRADEKKKLAQVRRKGGEGRAGRRVQGRAGRRAAKGGSEARGAPRGSTGPFGAGQEAAHQNHAHAASYTRPYQARRLPGLAPKPPTPTPPPYNPSNPQTPTSLYHECNHPSTLVLSL